MSLIKKYNIHIFTCSWHALGLVLSLCLLPALPGIASADEKKIALNQGANPKSCQKKIDETHSACNAVYNQAIIFWSSELQTARLQSLKNPDNNMFGLGTIEKTKAEKGAALFKQIETLCTAEETKCIKGCGIFTPRSLDSVSGFDQQLLEKFKAVSNPLTKESLESLRENYTKKCTSDSVLDSIPSRITAARSIQFNTEGKRRSAKEFLAAMASAPPKGFAKNSELQASSQNTKPPYKAQSKDDDSGTFGSGALMLGLAGVAGAGLGYLVAPDGEEEIEKLEEEVDEKQAEIEALKKQAEAAKALDELNETGETATAGGTNTSGGTTNGGTTASATDCTDELRGEERREVTSLVTNCWSGGNTGADCQNFYQLYCQGQSATKSVCDEEVTNKGQNTSFCLRFANESACGSSGKSGSPTCQWITNLSASCKQNISSPECLYKKDQGTHNAECANYLGDPVCSAVTSGSFALGQPSSSSSVNLSLTSQIKTNSFNFRSVSDDRSSNAVNLNSTANGLLANDIYPAGVNLSDQVTNSLLYECNPAVNGLDCSTGDN